MIISKTAPLLTLNPSASSDTYTSEAATTTTWPQQWNKGFLVNNFVKNLKPQISKIKILGFLVDWKKVK